MRFFFPSLLSLLLLISCGDTKKKANEKLRQVAICYSSKTTDKDWYTSDKKAPLFKGLEGIDFKISTVSKEAQDYFNQGLMLSYGFNHAEAARSFYQATRLDSYMCYGFLGLCLSAGTKL